MTPSSTGLFCTFSHRFHTRDREGTSFAVAAFPLALVVFLLVASAPADSDAASSSGTCGDGLTWGLDSEGNLSITGQGPMVDYGGGDASPWYSNGSIKTVSISDGVTSIGEYAFYDCSTLRSVDIPDSVVRIGDSAFSGCSSLVSATIGDGVTHIGKEAFRGCGLRSVDIPSSVESIGGYVFYRCTSLSSVTFVDGVTDIGDHMFSGCTSLSSVTIPDSVRRIDQYAFSGCSSLSSVDIPDSVECILEYAFSGCTSLSSVTIGDSVTSIGKEAFRGCGLRSVNIPGSVISIGMFAFYECPSLVFVTIGDGVTDIGDYMFSGCSSLVSVDIPDSVEYIGFYAFEGCSSLSSVTIPDSVRRIDQYAFSGCSSLSSATIGKSVASIGSYAFSGCSSLSSVTFGDGVTYIGDHMFSGCSSLTSVDIPDSVECILEYAFSGCSSLSSITISDSVTSIDSNAFSGLVFHDGDRELGYGELPGYMYIRSDDGILYRQIEDIISVGTDFSEGFLTFKISGLNPATVSMTGTLATIVDVQIPSVVSYQGTDFSVTSIGGSAFECCTALESVSIPDSVTSIGGWAFNGCYSLRSVTIPGSVTSIGEDAFSYCESLESIELGDGVETMGDRAFYQCGSLSYVTIPSSVASIGYEAFAMDPDFLTIEYIYDEDGFEVGEEYVGDRAFYEHVTPLGYGQLPGYTYVGKGDGKLYRQVPGSEIVARGTCGENLSWELDSEGNLSIFGYGPMTDYSRNVSPWYNNASIKKVTISDSVTSIGANAFSGCSSLISVTNRSVLWITAGGSGYGGVALHASEVVGSVVRLQTGDFTVNCNDYGGVCAIVGYSGDASSLVIPEKIAIGDGYCSVMSIGDSVFLRCTSLQSVTIPDSVTYIGDSVFEGCSSLQFVTILGPVTSIGGYAFYGCHSLLSISVEDYSSSYASEDGVLFNRYMTELIHYPAARAADSYDIPDFVRSIRDYAFYGCSSLQSVDIPDSVTSIGWYAFEGCFSLSSISVDGYNSSYASEDGVLFDKSMVELIRYPSARAAGSYDIPDSVQYIQDHAFNNCSALRSVSIPGSVTNIQDYAFKGCESLQSITVDGSNQGYESEDGVLFSKGMTALIQYPAGKTDMEYTIPDSVRYVGDNAFLNCTILQSVYIPDPVTYIGNAAFHNCISLQSITLDKSNQSYESEDGVLFSKDMTELIQYPAGKTDMEYTIPDSVSWIRDNAFSGCTALRYVTIPDSVDYIDWSAFECCTSLESVDIPDSIRYIRFWAFSGCTSLRLVTIPSSIESIDSDAFLGLKFYDGDRKLGYDELPGHTYVGSGDGNLYRQTEEAVSVGDVFTEGPLVFEVSGLDPATVSVTGFALVADGMDVPSAVSYGGIDFAVTSIGDHAFAGCAFDRISFPSTLAGVSAAAFDVDFHKGSKVLSVSATNLKGKTFSGMGGHLYLEGSVVKNTVIETDGFTFKVVNMGPTRVSMTGAPDGTADLVVPDTVSAGGLTFAVTSVAEGAFSGRTDLRSVDLGSVTTVYAKAFEGCTGLERVAFPDSLKTISKSSFDVDFHKGSKVLSESATNLKGKTFSGMGGHLYLEGSVAKNTVIETGTMTFKVVDLDNLKARLTGAYPDIVDLVVPDTVTAGGLTFAVTSVDSGAFSGRADLRSVDLGSVTTVYGSAFSGCTGLERVSFPDSLKTIYKSSFDVAFMDGSRKVTSAAALAGGTFEGTDGTLVLTS